MTADGGQVQGHGAPALRAVHMEVDAAAGEGLAEAVDRQSDAADIRDMGHRQHARPRRQGREKGGEQSVLVRGIFRDRYAYHSEAVAGGADVPGDGVGRMVLVPEHDFVPGTEVEAGIDDIVGLAGVAHQRDLGGRDAELSSDGRARGLQQLAEARAVLEGAVEVNGSGQAGYRIRYGAR